MIAADDKHTVKSFRLPSVDGKSSFIEFSQLMAIKKKEVEFAKNAMDVPYSNNPRLFSRISGYLEPASNFRSEISLRYKTPNVTNAWLRDCSRVVIRHLDDRLCRVRLSNVRSVSRDRHTRCLENPPLCGL